MLKIFGSIKRNESRLMLLSLFILSSLVSETTLAQTASPNPTAEKPAGLSFFASARLKTPDRAYESSTSEVRVNLDGTQSVVLKGRLLNVTLETEPSGFSRAQMVRVSASGSAGRRGDSASFSAGIFKVADRGEHNFLFVEKSRGWILEVKLRPIEVPKPNDQQRGPSKNQSPARYINPKRLKRAPA